ncbi:hypothetical protein RJ55_06075 [Drechmeria coniospora]|nr:hypothetical protein RJ55_06075 [Drechmeria coniospora]
MAATRAKLGVQAPCASTTSPFYHSFPLHHAVTLVLFRGQTSLANVLGSSHFSQATRALGSRTIPSSAGGLPPIRWLASSCRSPLKGSIIQRTLVSTCWGTDWPMAIDDVV